MNPPRRSICPIACTLDLVGDKWSLLVVRDLACGKTQFRDFLASPERIATNILTDRLGRLVEHGFAERFQPAFPGAREGYRLTARGQSLRPILEAVAMWGLTHLEGTEAQLRPVSE